MSVELEIRDGDPWWLSPDVWVVPGDDPEGTPALPIAGLPAYMWARVRNNGTSTVSNAEVRFYWADPSSAFDRNTAHYVGSSYVSLGPSEVSDVLLLVPWIPEFVNNGHECILAEAFHLALDPLPPSPVFNVPTDDHVAQRNLSVVVAAADGFFHFNFNTYNTARKTMPFTLMAEISTAAALKPLLETLGQNLELGSFNGQVKDLGFVKKRCPDVGDLDKALEVKLEIDIQGNRKENLSLIGKIKGGPALIHITQYHQERRVGGLSLVVLAAETGKISKRG